MIDRSRKRARIIGRDMYDRQIAEPADIRRDDRHARGQRFERHDRCALASTVRQDARRNDYDARFTEQGSNIIDVTEIRRAR